MKKLLTLFVLLLYAGACKEAYDPPAVSTDHAFLVVEGFINNGPDSTVITLSHTYKLDNAAQAAPETGAAVNVEGSDNSVFALPEAGNGQYGADLTTLNPATQYRLHIVTRAGKEYRSDFVAFKASPPIDSINWVRTGDGVQIYANTHDPQQNSTYYLWKYEETWEFHSVYYSEYEYLSAQDTIVARPVNNIYFCWTGDNSTKILLGSSARLASDLIYEAPLLLIPSNSWHISVEYSMLVKQYVLTADAYNFWLNLQLNTEQIGSVFSPQPSQLRGNIHSLSDPTEQVLGYVSAGSLAKQRIFITPATIPNWTTTEYPNSCEEISILGIPDSERFWLAPANNLVVDLDQTQPGPPLPPFRYFIAYKPCVDCTQLGVNNKPSFMP